MQTLKAYWLQIIRLLASAGLLFLVAGCGGGSSTTVGPPVQPPTGHTATLDLATFDAARYVRVSGGKSTGSFGVPVAGGYDCDQDGHVDLAMSAMVASPQGRSDAGQVHLLFGNGRTDWQLDTAQDDTRQLVIIGAGQREIAGSEIWMGDLNGDGVGDLVIGRQNYRNPVDNRIGAGAVSVILGNSALRDLANNLVSLDLAAPPPGIAVITLVGAKQLDRLGMWFRTGDVTGDGLDDLLIGADQADTAGMANSGSAWLLRGGAHLDKTMTIDLAEFGSTALAGHILKIEPPTNSADYHFGATVALADLDNNMRSEILISASLSRAGGQLLADGAPAGSATRNGGNPGGSLFIVWDDNVGIAPAWAAGRVIKLDNPPGSMTRIDGGSNDNFNSLRFAEDIAAGKDYDGDNEADIFAGDIRGTALGRNESGIGHVIFSAAGLRGLEFSIDAPPANVRVTHIYGIEPGAISADTSLHGDIDGDGITDLAISSPLASPAGRRAAGMIHVLWGQNVWPTSIDLLQTNRPTGFAITDILGARGGSPDDAGDTLMYSAAAADINADGRDDLIINEMRGNGLAPDAIDVGNLLVINGTSVPKP